MTDVSQLAQRHEEQGDLSSSPARRLLSDPAFPVPTEPCLPGPPLACQDVRENSFLANWWSKVLDSSAAASANTHTSANSQGLHSRLQRRQHRGHNLNGQSLFDLEAIHLQLVQVIRSGATNCLELPRYTGKAQKREVCCCGAADTSTWQRTHHMQGCTESRYWICRSRPWVHCMVFSQETAAEKV